MKPEPIILYIDDNAESRMIMEILLADDLKFSQYMILDENEDFSTIFERLPFQPTIIFLDIHMSPLDGFDLLRIIRGYEVYQNTPILAMTASVMDDEVKLLQEVGFNGLVAKPIHQTKFSYVLNSILNGEEVWQI